jgi:hypothetical protein
MLAKNEQREKEERRRAADETRGADEYDEYGAETQLVLSGPKGPTRIITQ